MAGDSMRYKRPHDAVYTYIKRDLYNPVFQSPDGWRVRDHWKTTFLSGDSVFMQKDIPFS